MGFRFNHLNFNVTDLQKSLAFYGEALGLKETHRLAGKRLADEGGNFEIVYLGDGVSDFELELTWLESHPQKYDLGEAEFHLAFEAADYDTAFAKHEKMGCICLVNDEMGIYFIEDPDGYWIEIIPEKK